MLIDILELFSLLVDKNNFYEEDLKIAIEVKFKKNQISRFFNNNC